MTNTPSVVPPERADIVPAAPAAAAAPPESPLTVLAAVAEPDLLDALSRMLADAGHRPVPARTGRRALHLLDKVRPDVALVGLTLPDLDGPALLRAAARAARPAYAIALGAADDEAAAREAFAAGADDYLPAPVTAAALRVRLQVAHRLLRQRHQRDRDLGVLRRHAADLAGANRRLRAAALTDSLTGLPNRRAAMDHLARAWGAAGRGGEALACLVADIDHFKRINDTYGHDAGDRVLQETAGLLRATARRADVLCRLGGEEFLALCPRTDLDEAQRCAERMRECVEAARVVVGEVSHAVTVSVGVAVRDARMHYAADLLRAADGAVYAAKRAGRNCVGLTVPKPNARRAPRVPVPGGSGLRVELEAGGRGWQPTPLDLSVLGILVEFPEPGDPDLAVGTPLGVRLRLGPLATRLDGVVCRRQQRRYGLGFLQVERAGLIDPPAAVWAVVAALEREWLDRTMR